VTPAELAEPTPADIAGRLGEDAEHLAARLDEFCGEVPDETAHRLHRLHRLRQSIGDLID
jgi:hypothetical protein